MPIRFLLLGLLWAWPCWAQDVLIHNHSPRLIPAGVPLPQLQIKLYPDDRDGFNLQILVRNYQLQAPPQSSEAAPDSLQGHAHLLLNGKKRQRLYGSWYHLSASMLQPGLNQLTVTLNSHQHETWIIGKQPVLATIFFDTSKDPAVQHNFAAFPLSPAPDD